MAPSVGSAGRSHSSASTQPEWFAHQLALCKTLLSTLHPDHFMLFPNGVPFGRTTDLEELAQELEDAKELFVAVESEREFIRECVRYDELVSQEPDAVEELQDSRDEAESRVRALQADIKAEQEEHCLLYKDISEASDGLRALHEQAEKEFAKVVSMVSQSIDGTKHAELANIVGPESGELRELLDDWQQTLHAIMSSEHPSLKDEPAAKQRRLTIRCRAAERLRASTDTESEHVERLEIKHQRKIQHAEWISQQEAMLGLPEIHFDEEQGLVVLSLLGQEIHPEPLRSVRVAYDARGHLRRADPHPSLELWDEARCSVERDDLPRLLTLTWHKLCELHR